MAVDEAVCATAVPALKREVAALGRHDQLVPGVASPGPDSCQVRAIES